MFAPGKKIGKYRIVRHIDSSVIASVYAVSIPKSARPLALKLLEGQLVSDEWRHRFKREFEILKTIAHPNIIVVVDRGEYKPRGTTTGNPYLVTEYFDGVNLKNLVEGSSADDISPSTASHIVRQVALALEHAHSRSIVHRDIKPANILWNAEMSQVRVLDFGLAKDFSALFDESMTFAALGARGYSSYHKIRDPKNATRADDVYSLGAVYYYLLTGQPPFFTDGSEHDLIELIKAGEYTPVRQVRPDTPDDIADIISRMLDGDDTSRYVNCRQLLADLNRLHVFRADQNKVLLRADWGRAELSAYQLLVNKVFGVVNSERLELEIFARLASAVGRANSALVGLIDADGTRRKEKREEALGALAGSFTWLCALANRTGVDIESSVWRKFPGVCPYCAGKHTEKSGCSKSTKGALDVWRLRDIANEHASEMPHALRGWELLFAEVYPATTKKPIDYLSRKLVEELGEVADFLTRPKRRRELLRDTGVDFLAFELADIFAWVCHCSNVMRGEDIGQGDSALARILASRFEGEVCELCGGSICTCERERVTSCERLVEYRYLDDDGERKKDHGD